MVYSTCALHPVEDEAVIARILRDTEGAVSLVDASALVPGLKYKRGLNEWHLATKDCSQFFSKYSEVPEVHRSNMRPFMFPPTEEEAAKFNLDRCMRVLPHLQVTYISHPRYTDILGTLHTYREQGRNLEPWLCEICAECAFTHPSAHSFANLFNIIYLFGGMKVLILLLSNVLHVPLDVHFLFPSIFILDMVDLAHL